jgi:predicted TPR repeat methyltransferase
MTDLNTSWKDNKNIFQEQLQLNLNELNNENNYPQHWKDFLSIFKHIGTTGKLLDIGCGCGAYYALLAKNVPSIDYNGMDYSENAIDIAKKQWNYSNFFVKDIWDLDKNFVRQYDIIHTSAVFDVMNNGDEALNFILGLDPKLFIISRISFTDKPSYCQTYKAYNQLDTYRYYHNQSNFINICNNHKYNIYQFNTNLLLTHNA